MSEENKNALQEEEETLVPEEEVNVSETETSADTENVVKENEVVETSQASEEPETSTDESAEGAETIEDSEDLEVNTESDEPTEVVEETTEEVSGGYQSDINFSDYIDNIPQVRKGATIKGVIIRYDDETVYVDVRDKSEGKIPRFEFNKDPDFDLDAAIENKEVIDVYVVNVRFNDAGKDIQLSKSRVDNVRHLAEVEAFHNEKEPIVVKVVKQVKDGIIGAYKTVEIYTHRSQIENRTLSDADMAELVGTEMEILVTQFDTSKRRPRISGSRRTLINQIRKERSEDLWENIAVGDIYEAVVRNITKFGAFVDLGGVDGLVHISELSWNHIAHPSEVVSVGDVIQVYVKDFDKEKDRISLGYRRIEDDPYYNIEDKYPVGSVVKGEVTKILGYGAFVQIEEGLDALVHISEISDLHLEKPSDVLEVGQEVTAKVIEVSDERRRISISIRQVEPMNELRGEAKAREEKRQAQEAKRNANRVPTSYTDSSSTEKAPSDMELAFAAARGQLAEDVEEVEEVEETVEEASDVDVTDEAAEAVEVTEVEETVEDTEEETV